MAWFGRGAVITAVIVAASGVLAGCEAPPEEKTSASSSATPSPTLLPPPPSMAVPPPMVAPAPAGRGVAAPSAAKVAMPQQYQPDSDRFPDAAANGWMAAEDAPVSTFSLDVDTASYGFVRRNLREGHRPPAASVRVEEMVNYFPYNYAGPEKREEVLRATATVTPSPWKDGAKLLHIGLKGWDVARTARPRANLTFLIDVSGSMSGDDRLPLIQKALHQLGDGLRPDDKVAIVTYAGEAGVALPPTSAQELPKIMAAVDGLRAGGSTAGAAGIKTAYEQAAQMFDPQAVNRVILATDGDFNVGTVDGKSLEAVIADKRRTGVYLSIVGVGAGNLNDALTQRLAQAGNGQAAYLDSILEARKIWIEQLGASMVPLADDAKVQVEFNPAQVAEYRLVGYETRMLNRTDFANDRVDAGDLGSGHSVTAIYEFVPVGSKAVMTEPLRYGKHKAKAAAAGGTSTEYAFIKLRAKRPGEKNSFLTSWPVGRGNEVSTLAQAPDDLRFSVAVAGFAQLLRGELPGEAKTWENTISLADGARGADPHGWRAEAVQLMRAAQGLR
ncbi:MAG TPA: von Willebrand factor type A domain-containing protein [Magnetospirillum sp.]|nr:von Willebrand factor type A domain-containing protein [Magnetospirillum sp.]